MALTLVTGGTRSGKSAFAEGLVAAATGEVVYVATGAAGDPEMVARIAAHRARRPATWRTLETADPAAALRECDDDRPVIVDSVGSWIARLLEDAGLLRDEVSVTAPEAVTGIRARIEELAAAAARRAGPTVVVCEQAGLGLLPTGAAARRWLDLVGDAAQLLAAGAERVLLVVAGRALELPAASTAAAGDWLALRVHGDTMVPAGAEDFAVNVDAPSPPEWLATELQDALRAGAGAYPREDDAVAAIAQRHGRAPEEVVPTNGAAEALWLVAAALRARHAVCVHPTFTEPEAALRAFGRPVERVHRDSARAFALDVRAVPARADLVLLGNPNNPSGTLDPADAIAALCRPGRTVVVDEAFMDFVPGERESLAARDDLPGLVVVRSLTKAYGLAGVRAGYLLAPPPVASALRAVRPAWSANALALAALRACTRRPDARAALAARVAAARDRLGAAVARLPGVETWPAAANFLLLRVPDGRRVHAELLRRQIAVRPCGTFPGLTDDYLRVTVRDPSANARFAAQLAEVLA